jgi:nicotinate-nucleotide pyrophosphorylase (carboxylating)
VLPICKPHVSINGNLQADIEVAVTRALREDIGDRDVTADLIPTTAILNATVVAREEMTLAGRPWAEEVFRQIDNSLVSSWNYSDGDLVSADSVLFSVQGPARAILTAERSALNFLQVLSATATVTSQYVEAIAGTACRILDTRKTIPGMRLAQKYAVLCGGGFNHRIGLFDAILIKENHIHSAGSITAAVSTAHRLHPGLPVEVEVESIGELRESLAAGVDRLLLDNFSPDLLAKAVAINRAEGHPPAELEASGGITFDELHSVAATGVDFISVGALTKNIRAIDLSMRFE